MMFINTEADYRICDCGDPESIHGWTRGDEQLPCMGVKCSIRREPRCAVFSLNEEMTFYVQNGREWSRLYDPNVELTR